MLHLMWCDMIRHNRLVRLDESEYTRLGFVRNIGG
jgi:hypothetical protein